MKVRLANLRKQPAALVVERYAHLLEADQRLPPGADRDPEFMDVQQELLRRDIPLPRLR